ncbi:putative multi-sensor signal transduction histidine kinase [Actinoplanes missouriensis 431]|uniref:histidine kinase n=1 Tax=Actinoplanes missouriensis (strain ATCC 14538 / DSM 43046 / CBS 188.64 / JCM 3121 / NBRC 102363 / NCIMB 12654 / NRRL B-3342 / UNCC 431) TaxID=512565 RepID=I0H1R7_ACTM4|nr:PAS domain-containing sensor histidine kinase [Actinoplanes missouriensis]BAL86954.1 putative multi-sensor signal transduction histidine kinase [Actinoplanes missouriensis 431]
MPEQLVWIWALAWWNVLTCAAGVWYWTVHRRRRARVRGAGASADPRDEQRVAEADAREQAARAMLEAVVEHTADGIIGVSLGGVVTAWNAGAERIFGWSAEEIVGRPVTVLADPAALAEQHDIAQRIAGGERGIHYESRRYAKDGTPVEASFSVAPIHDHHGEISGAAIVVRDVTAAKAAAERQRAVEERTHQAQRLEALGKLAGGVAHDFNNILAIIVNYTDFAAEEAAGNPALETDLRHVRNAADRAINLTRQLLTFTRGDTIQPQDVDLNAALAEVQAMLGRTIGEHINLITVPSKEPITVHADPGQLQQILLNLAINARDAMPDGGTLVLEANAASLDGDEINMQPPLPAGTYARLLVSDTGEGMSPETAARIFEPFYTTKPQGKGTGLGLSTVYGIVTEAGGSLNVYSELGVGTTFRIYLPMVAVPERAGPVTLRPEPAGGGGRTVLVVEDEPVLARVVARILTGGGYHVLTATGTDEALALFRQHDCDAMLTDVIMPETSGRRLADIVHESRPDLPVLYMSGYSNGLLGTTHVLDDDIAFIEKPFTAHDLLLKLGEVLLDHPLKVDSTTVS